MQRKPQTKHLGRGPCTTRPSRRPHIPSSFASAQSDIGQADSDAAYANSGITSSAKSRMSDSSWNCGKTAMHRSNPSSANCAS